MQLHQPTPPAEPVVPPHHKGPSAELIEPDSEWRLIASLRAVATMPPLAQLARAAAAFAQLQDMIGNACADLAVTGRAAVARYDAATPTVEQILAEAQAQHGGVGELAAARAAHRAAAVRRWLPLSRDERAQQPNLGWIAVSGEDDPPWRPVNAEVTRFPQRDLDVVVHGQPLRLRYAQTGPLAGSKVVVLLHGHSSRLEECEEVLDQLHAMREPNGVRTYTALALDLPGCGYSTQPPPDVASVDFIWATVVAFVEGVFAAAGRPVEVACIGGGSLGGNLSLIFGEQQPPWLLTIAPWSPAAMWGFNLVVHSVGLVAASVRAQEVETSARRAEYFHRVFEDDAGGNQSEQWYSAKWPGRANALAASQRDRREVYSERFRRWHWAIAAAQLPQRHDEAALKSIGCPVLILAGADDDHTFTHIAGRVKDAAEGPLRDKPGAAYLLTDVGHSIHNERPAFLAEVIHQFLTTYARRNSVTTDIKLQLDTVVIDATYLEVAGPGGTALELDGIAARQRDGGAAAGERRRALCHATGDQLVVNYEGDYLGGVTINGGVDGVALVGTVRVPVGSKLTVARTVRTAVESSMGRTRPMFMHEDVELDVFDELRALRAEVAALKAKVGL